MWGLGKLVEIPQLWHLLGDILGAQLSCQASNTLQLAGEDSNKPSVLVVTWCLVFSKRCSWLCYILFSLSQLFCDTDNLSLSEGAHGECEDTQRAVEYWKSLPVSWILHSRCLD